MTATTTEREQLVNVRGAAEILGVSIFTVRRLARAGTVPVVRFGRRGHLRFRLDDLERMRRPERSAA